MKMLVPTLNITAKTDEHVLVYRRETEDRCYLDCEEWRVMKEWWKAYQDDERASKSRFAGTLVRRAVGKGNLLWMPYGVARPELVCRLGDRLKSRMYDACSGLNAESLPVAPASMAKDYIGCSLSELAEKFEDQFEDGMTWENFGARGWVIDHIIPLATFDLRRIEQVSKACHYTNLRPCWEAENSRKKDRLVLIAERDSSR